MTDLTDEQLMLNYQSGESEAIQMLFERYKNRILNFCLRLLQNRAEAEDAMSDVFLALFKAGYRFDPKAKFSTWLFTIARNQCISQIRKKKPVFSLWGFKKDGQYTELEIEDKNAQADQNIQKQEVQDRVKQSIQKLPFNQREVIILREYHQFSYEEIAKILDCSLEKVKILIFRARENLRVELASFIKEDI